MAFAARCSGLSATSTSTFQKPASPIAGLKASVCFRAAGPSGTPSKARHHRVLAAKEGGSGVVDRPTVSPNITRSSETNKTKPPIYNVMLHNDNYNKREYVVKVLLQVVEGYKVDDAVNVMQEAHINGLALVIACAQDTAEEYVEKLRLNGLISTLEPGH